jgi:hypothetical protein
VSVTATTNASASRDAIEAKFTEMSGMCGCSEADARWLL